MKSFKLLKIPVYFLILSLILTVAGCGKKLQKAENKPVKKIPVVAVRKVERGHISQILNTVGESVPIEIAKISSTVEGPIVFCPWREGDRIVSGQKLIEIDRETLKAEVKASEAALFVAQAKLADMKAGTRPEEIERIRQSLNEAKETMQFEKLDYERIKELVKAGALPGEQEEKARLRFVAAQAKVNSLNEQLKMLEQGYTATAIAVQEAAIKEAQARLDLAKARLKESVINAPFNGVITKVFVRPGDLAELRKPLLEITNLSSQVVRCSIPEQYLSKVKIGLPARIQFDAFGEKWFPASVSRIFPDLDPQLRTKTIELVLREMIQISPNMFARIQLILETVKDANIAPEQAILTLPGGKEVVFVVENQRAVQKSVETGIREGEKVQIISGLFAGEKVVVAGQEKLKDKAEVKVAGEDDKKVPIKK
ncbi:MAG: efflux RND transporter periplasmic adaptor subunit [Candidatus Omnitrophica bacterium]|nr:efflux RND transporter periplasmic adaptor subunit [Candidatus Omnitrophota bacterium]